MAWVPPDDIDPEVVSLCRAMNALPGIATTESCSGHGQRPVRIWFIARSLENLPALLYWFSPCHTGQYGWRVEASTDCAARHAVFTAEGPPGAFDAAEAIAACIQEAAVRG